MEDMEQIIFQLILHGGNGRSSAMEAIHAAKQGNFIEARTKLQDSTDGLNEAHKFQTKLIQAELKGEKTETSLLMVHAQDHLMNAMTLKDMAAEFVDLYEYIKLMRGVEL